MAYVDGFEHDVFISYSHVDNQSLYPDRKHGWVDEFHEVLQIALRAELGGGHGLSVWQDNQLELNERFNGSIPETCRNSAVFVCIVSAAYLKSEWCTREREAFMHRWHEPPLPGKPHLSPIFVANRSGVKPEELPAPLSEVTYMSYFDPGVVGGRPECVRRPFGDPDQRFIERTKDLAGGIARYLVRLKEQNETRQTTAAAAPITGSPPREGAAQVFLADCTEDVADARRELQRSLEQEGISVVPAGAQPADFNSLSAAITRLLQQSTLSVHILGSSYGKFVHQAGEPSRPARSLPHLQYELAAEADVRRIVWQAPHIEHDPELAARQAEFLQSLRNDQADGFEPLTCDIEQLKTLVRDRVRPPRPTPPRAEIIPYIKVVARGRDIKRPEMSQIMSACCEHGADVESQQVDEVDEQAMQAAKIFHGADGLIIFYGSDDPAWLKSRVQETIKRIPRRKKCPLLAAVIDGPPADERPPAGAIKRSPLVMLINARDGVRQDLFAEFFQQFRPRRAR